MFRSNVRVLRGTLRGRLAQWFFPAIAWKLLNIRFLGTVGELGHKPPSEFVTPKLASG